MSEANVLVKGINQVTIYSDDGAEVIGSYLLNDSQYARITELSKTPTLAELSVVLLHD
jgi:hypothetical protein